MMDETVIEILSRHLDGDLGPDEERQIKTRLEAEPALAAELEAMRRVRRSVAALAASETAPVELDTLVEPLLRGKPKPILVRPWARWLAAAAVVVLGLTVVIEVNRRRPGPNVSSIARMSSQSQAKPTERFSLAPLPTSSLPPERQPLGASDRLLASPIPEVELEDPEPLEVIGPLNEAEMTAPLGQDVGAEPRGTIAGGAAVDADVAKNTPEQPAPSTAKRERKPSIVHKEKVEPSENGRGAGAGSWEGGLPKGRARLFVFIDGKSAWREFAPTATCEPGRYAVRIVIGGGAVREARPVGGAASASPSQRLCAAELVINLEIDNVADGEYPAEVVVEPRGAGRQRVYQ